MERNLTIVDTDTQKCVVIKSSASTIAELKNDLRQNGISVDGKIIQEAITRTEFKDDTSMLPHDVPYKGQVTNDLVFRLTKQNKNIKSGIDRKEAYEKIKSLGIADIIKAKYGKNFTQVSTADLEKCINEHTKKAAPAPKENIAPAPKAPEKHKPESKPESKPEREGETAIERLCLALLDRGIITESVFAYVLDGKEETNKKDEKTGNIYSDEELNALLNGL